jgi:DNA-binding CsgD family transcriptional regulator
VSLCPVLIGRQEELGALTAALGTGGLVLVAGEAGIGKSRLLREAAAVATDAGHAVVWARPEVVSAPGPYSVIVDLIEEIAAGSVQARGEAAELAASLAGASGELAARHVAARVRGVIGALGARPVLMIEDLHAADELSQAVIAHLARSAYEDGVLLVGTYRPEEATAGGLARMLDVLQRDRLVTQIELRPLEHESLVEMVAAMWGRPPTSDELATIERLGEGIPLFIEELATAAPAPGMSVPTSIALGVAARLERLDPAAGSLMKIASLMIGAIDPAVIELVADESQDVILQSLVHAVAAGVLTDREGRLVFRHALVREAIAASIVSVQRVELHRRIAAAIERHHASDLAPHAFTVAQHLAAGDRSEEAARWWLLAGRRALDVGAFEEAERCIAAARASASDALSIEAMECESTLQMRHANWPVAATLLESAIKERRTQGPSFEEASSVAKLARLYALMQRREQAIGVLDEAIGLAVPDSRAHALLLVTKGFVLTRMFEDADAGEPFLREGLMLAEATRNVEARIIALDGLAWAEEFRHSSEEAHRFGEAARRLALELDDDELVVRTHLGYALRLGLRGACTQAIEVLQSARERLTARPLGADTLNWIDHSMAWLMWRMGQPAEAERYASRLEGTRWTREYARLVRAWAVRERGDHELSETIMNSWWEELGGTEHRAASRARPTEIPDPADEAVIAVMADLYLEALREPVAPELIDPARAFAEMCATVTDDIRCLTALTYARALAGVGERTEAASVLSSIEPMASIYPWHRATLLEIRASLEASAEGFAEAAAVFERAENASDRARCLRRQAELLEDRSQAVEVLKTAASLAREVGAVSEANHAESALRALGVRPRAGRPKGSGIKKGSVSAREEEVVVLLSGGATNAEIGARLFLSERTVRDHIANAQRRLGVSGRPGLVAWAVKQGLI